jgi:hypothetical protein
MDRAANFRSRLIRATIITIIATSLCRAQTFNWEWQASQYLAADQSLSNSSLKEPEKALLRTAIANEIRDYGDGRESDKQLQDAALKTRILSTDLNRDGQPEIIAQGTVGCSPTGNCPFWVFRKMNGAYKLLLNGVGQTFTLQQSYTNGFRDIVVAMHDSAFESSLTLYRYDGTSYHDRECHIASWADRNDPSRQLDQPRIAQCSSP